MGSILHDRFGTKKPGMLVAPAGIAVGKRWQTVFTERRNGVVSENYDFHVVALESVTVPAGTFKACKVERRGGGAPSHCTELHDRKDVDRSRHHARGPRRAPVPQGRPVTEYWGGVLVKAALVPRTPGGKGAEVPR